MPKSTTTANNLLKLLFCLKLDAIGVKAPAIIIPISRYPPTFGGNAALNSGGA